MNKSKIFLILSLSFLGGIFWRSFFPGQEFIYIFLILAVIAAVPFYRNKYILIFTFSCFLFFLGFWKVEKNIQETKNLNLDNREISEKAIVIKEPERKDKFQNIVVEVEKNYKVLINVGIYEDLEYGDELDIGCTLKIPENKNDEFDYRMYLAKDNIFYVCQNASIEKNGENKGNLILKNILSLKNKLSNNTSKVIPEPESALAKGLLFGGSSQLPKEVSDDFSKTGLSHIVAVSGFNVTIIAEYLMVLGIFLGFWRKQAFWFAILGIFLFIFSVGFPSSAVRAGIMGSLLIWAMKNGRLANSFNAIIFSASVMLMFNPLLLRWDIGFQLSFLAALGITEMSPFWENYLIKKGKFFGILENVFLTLSATIFVLPIIIYNFHIISVVSLLANFLILPVVPLAMFLVFLTSLVGLINSEISLPFAWLAFLVLKYITVIVEYLASFKWSSLEIKNFSVGWLIAWYSVLFLPFYFIKYKIKKNLKLSN